MTPFINTSPQLPICIPIHFRKWTIPKRNCPFILQIIMLWLLQRLHRRELFDWAFVSLQIFAKADILLLLQTVRAAYVIIGCHAEKRVGACLVRWQAYIIC